MLVAGNGGGGAFFPLLLQLPLPLDRLVATVDTLYTLELLALYRELFLLFQGVNAEDEVVAVETLAIDGAYDLQLEWAAYESEDGMSGVAVP
jgi:hypothetical protein